MRCLLVISVILFGSAIGKLVSGSIPDFILQVWISIFLIITYFFFKREKKKSEVFLQWLIENKNDIYLGKAQYNGYRIDLDTKITQFEFCLSLGIFTVRVPSRFLLSDDFTTIFLKLVYTVGTMIFGWWGLPWGPIYTIKIIIKNLSGGTKKNIEDYLPVRVDNTLISI